MGCDEAKHGRREFCGLLAGMTVGAIAGAVKAEAGSCGPPPKAKPHRVTGGESFAPLPLPVTPLRRSEKKRPPAPPALIGKIEYGKIVKGTDERGNVYTYRDWTTDPSDIPSLMEKAKRALNLDYRGVPVTLDTFSWSPAETPMLYLTGHEGFEFDGNLRKKLYWFLQDGGCLIGEACCGKKEYLESFMREMNAIFPRKKMEILPPDHPLFAAFYNIEQVGMIGEDQKPFKSRPVIHGIDMYCRTAVLFSPYDLSCGWDGHRHDQGRRVWSDARGGDDAVCIGINMIACALACYQQGRQLASAKVYRDAEESSEEKFVWGQIVHEGDWDPDPNAAANLMKFSAANTALEVKFKKVPVDLGKLDAFRLPLLYITGHDEFKFSEEEVAALRRHLKNGGFLLADACCGRKAFDAAFRREIVRVLPGAKLEALPSDHPVYSAAGAGKVARAEYSPRLRKSKPDMDAPTLEGITLAGATCVIYSPYDIGCGLEDADCPYCLGYEKADARRLGMNILIYGMTH
ncbi:MAG: DUF4159 domain-containing protein [Planctomycetota bacterium]|nr:DUF4159 domain-containing protein [Planctomycetota bacterium]